MEKGTLAVDRSNEFAIFRKNLILLRTSIEMSGVELSETLRFSKKRINDFEGARTNPSLYELKKIADYFSISIDDLISKKAIIKFIEDMAI